MNTTRFDPEILALIPHRPPMLLINQIIDLGPERSETVVLIDEQTPFYTNNGVPAWIGLEYMGQSSALIAGYQERKGLCEPQLGFLMGSRKYQTEVDHFRASQSLRVICEQGTLVGTSLANFNCRIETVSEAKLLASASLSVFRRPLTELDQERA